MERVIQIDNLREQAKRERWDGGSGDSVSPFQYPDESPSVTEWRIHNAETDTNQDCPLGFKESWSFGKVVFKRYYRHDFSEASLDRNLGSWTRDTVNTTAHRLLGSEQCGCTYSVRIRGACVTISGGTSALSRLIDMAVWTKQGMLQSPCGKVESTVSGGCPEGENAFDETSE